MGRAAGKEVVPVGCWKRDGGNEIKEKKEFIVAAQDQGAQMGTAQRA